MRQQEHLKKWRRSEEKEVGADTHGTSGEEGVRSDLLMVSEEDGEGSGEFRTLDKRSELLIKGELLWRSALLKRRGLLDRRRLS